MQFISRKVKDVGISFTEDIVKEMSEELGIPEKEIREIVDKNIQYIKKSVAEKPILLISLPNLTKLRFNLKLGMSSVFTNSKLNSISASKKVESLQGKVDLLKGYYNPKLVSFNKPLFERFYKKITNYKKAFYIYDKMYHMWAVVERRSNEILKEIK